MDEQNPRSAPWWLAGMIENDGTATDDGVPVEVAAYDAVAPEADPRVFVASLRSRLDQDQAADDVAPPARDDSIDLYREPPDPGDSSQPTILIERLPRFPEPPTVSSVVPSPGEPESRPELRGIVQRIRIEREPDPPAEPTEDFGPDEEFRENTLSFIPGFGRREEREPEPEPDPRSPRKAGPDHRGSEPTMAFPVSSPPPFGPAPIRRPVASVPPVAPVVPPPMPVPPVGVAATDQSVPTAPGGGPVPPAQPGPCGVPAPPSSVESSRPPVDTAPPRPGPSGAPSVPPVPQGSVVPPVQQEPSMPGSSAKPAAQPAPQRSAQQVPPVPRPPVTSPVPSATAQQVPPGGRMPQPGRLPGDLAQGHSATTGARPREEMPATEQTLSDLTRPIPPAPPSAAYRPARPGPDQHQASRPLPYQRVPSSGYDAPPPWEDPEEPGWSVANAPGHHMPAPEEDEVDRSDGTPWYMSVAVGVLLAAVVVTGVLLFRSFRKPVVGVPTAPPVTAPTSDEPSQTQPSQAPTPTAQPSHQPSQADPTPVAPSAPPSTESTPPPRTPKATPKSWPPSGATECSSSIAVNSHTSCAFAENVARAFDAAGVGTVTAYSPVTGQDYSMSCREASTDGLYVCTGGNDAKVYLR